MREAAEATSRIHTHTLHQTHRPGPGWLSPSRAQPYIRCWKKSVEVLVFASFFLSLCAYLLVVNSRSTGLRVVIQQIFVGMRAQRDRADFGFPLVLGESFQHVGGEYATFQQVVVIGFQCVQ